MFQPTTKQRLVHFHLVSQRERRLPPHTADSHLQNPKRYCRVGLGDARGRKIESLCANKVLLGTFDKFPTRMGGHALMDKLNSVKYLE